MTSGRCGRGPRPWRHDTSWPPHPGFGADARARAWFFRRLALAAMALVALAAFGIIAIAWAIGDRVGAPGLALLPVAIGLLISLVVFIPAVRSLRRGVAPLRAVMDAADRVADGDYEVRVGEHGPPPVRALARSFNAMTERLQHADTLRRELMADVAHELRTPLSVLQGRLEGLADGVYPRDDAQIAALLEETAVLSTLVEDLRTLALADAGVLRLQPEPTDLVGLVQSVVGGFESEAARRGVTLRVEWPGGEVEHEVDPLRIRQVLTNLLSNALRHTPSGRAITVTVSTSDRTGASVMVADEGAGIAAEELPRIFDRFYKSEGSRGSGLGLTIAKRLVAAHGGEITASSRAGQGTTVVFTLPSR
jgi:signal transduction histidine kinase